MRALMNRFVRSQDGVAIPVTLILLIVFIMLAGFAAAAAMQGNSQSQRDRKVKRALGAADAGINVATYRLDKLIEVVTPATPCVIVDSVGRLTIEGAMTDGWCREQGEDLGDGAGYRYRVSNRSPAVVNGINGWQQKIVSTGTVGAVQRRALTTVFAPFGDPLFLFDYGVFSSSDVTFDNTSSASGSVASNGNVVLNNSATICGNIFFGPGNQFIQGSGTNSQCKGFTNQALSQPVLLPEVKLPRANDDSRIGTADPWTSPDGIQWDPSARVLKMTKSSSITLTGGDYVFCSVELTGNSQLIVPADGTPVRIFIDSPENCGGASGSFTLTSTSQVYNPSLDPRMAQLYVKGSPSTATSVGFYNLRDTWMTVFAPHSSVIYNNSNKFVGAAVGSQVTFQNSGQFVYDSRVATLAPSVLPISKRSGWKECTATAPSAQPDAGC
jgi:hypothetical protein